MELYYYLEDVDGGFVVDQYYMDNYYNPAEESTIMRGTKEEIDEYIEYLCNN